MSKRRSACLRFQTKFIFSSPIPLPAALFHTVPAVNARIFCVYFVHSRKHLVLFEPHVNINFAYFIVFALRIWMFGGHNSHKSCTRQVWNIIEFKWCEKKQAKTHHIWRDGPSSHCSNRNRVDSCRAFRRNWITRLLSIFTMRSPDIQIASYGYE